MTRRILAVAATLVVLPQLVVGRVSAAPGLAGVVATIRDADGHYRYGAATLTAADCSGLVSVAQSLAMGQPVHRFGDTRSLLAGRWPHAIPGAMPGDLFIIGANSTHMVAMIRGVGIEASTSGQPFLIGADAASVWEPRFRQWHIDPGVLVA